MRPPTRLLAGALLIGLAFASGPTDARAGNDDSPWPDTASTRANVRAIRSVVRDLENRVELMQESADRYDDWQSCIRGVPVSEYGDPDRQSGYLYDERDGTGLGHMPALAVDRTSRPRREDYLFLNFSRRGDCRSSPPLSGGTADTASVQGASRARAAGARRRPLPRTLTRLERRVRALKRAARRLLASSERFDEWESCVSWVPVTEYGDPDGQFGYLFGGPTARAYRPALAVDRSDWDDPDYMFLALVGGDRPGRSCQNEPGEAVD
jgi:hypothetical protein